MPENCSLFNTANRACHCVERSWKDWLVYLDVTNFIDKKYEEYRGCPGHERIIRLGVQWDF